MKAKKQLLLSLAIAGCCLTIVGCGKKDKSDTVYSPNLPTDVVESDIFVEQIEGISDDFIRGVDISSVLAEEASGVVYYDEDGNEADLFKVLADAGVNYIRVRVWNDPYDTNGKGYGGGTNDTAAAAEIGRRAAEYGMKLLVDYHYSDFWADPGKQKSPKAWAHLTKANKEIAFYEFTKESLTEIIDAGALVGMVQIGNETNNGMAGETDWTTICTLMNLGSKAIREVAEEKDQDIQIAVHFTNASDAAGIDAIAKTLETNNVDYDIFGLSYYIFWHGSFENLTTVMNNLVDTYGKKVMVAETSYAYTLEEGDGHTNSINAEDLSNLYAATVQSQASAVRDVMAAVAGIGEAGLGVFYWEPAWIPVEVYDYNSENAEEVLASNKALWEQYGSGWAASFAGKYDSKDAGVYFGGSSWENQAMFDFTGHPLASLNVFKYVKYGANATLAADFINNVVLDVNVDSKLVMPETVYVVFNDRSMNGDVPVTWEESQVAQIDTSKLGEYVIDGTLEDGASVQCEVNVAYVNWLKNPSFEEKDTSMWNLIYGDSNPADYQDKAADAYTGDYSLHFWEETEEVYFQAEQTVEDLANGKYYFSLYAQGGDVGSNPTLYVYVRTGTEEIVQEFALSGWSNWEKVEIPEFDVTDGTVTVGVYVKAAGGAWGTIDDFYLCASTGKE